MTVVMRCFMKASLLAINIKYIIYMYTSMLPTQFVCDKSIGLHFVGELVRLAAHDHRHVVRLGHQSHEGRPHPGHDVAISLQAVRTHQHLGHLCSRGRERGGRGEGRKEGRTEETAWLI